MTLEAQTDGSEQTEAVTQPAYPHKEDLIAPLTRGLEIARQLETKFPDTVEDPIDPITLTGRDFVEMIRKADFLHQFRPDPHAPIK